ncbi:hypothetical protein P872_09410 [Rhodonellum psychrophilum GCM71 = DSM 17998]|uniref:Uncharacterized protein n=1 Tax=Rhodonellum psychrophilum GCM71 = DSM 17998 TaxID=1123057 RepID=U5BZV4_9BACT|nr:hypothetical protein P872_09410 [Rhodonellum psychrophilum GCM71 = DSM 17998]
MTKDKEVFILKSYLHNGLARRSNWMIGQTVCPWNVMAEIKKEFGPKAKKGETFHRLV